MKYPHPIPMKLGLAMTAILAALFSMPVATQTAAVTVQPDPFQTPAYKQAFFDASRIYGKAGCGDIQLAEKTAEDSLRTGTPANVIASVIAAESNCKPLAVHTLPNGNAAVGIMQINVTVQSAKYAQFRAINLFNPDDNMKVGTEILAEMIKQYGLRGGISHYNGSGPDAEAYAVKVLALAGK